MKAESLITFPPFRLDPANERLWQGTQQIPLRPKPFAILRYLVEHSDRLVSKEELLKAVWPDTYVSEGLLNTYVRDLRRVLGDDPEAPRFIETVVRRGYRFIAPLTPAQPVQHLESGARTPDQPDTSLISTLQPRVAGVVGRQVELRQLSGWWDKALKGERQVVFVTGEPGIGKTTVVETFLEQAAAPGRVWVGLGQCIEHYGAGEAYLPVLEALGRLCREPGSERLTALLGRHAPTWLVQMPGLISDAEFEGLQRKVHGATRERMLRELAEALEVLTAERPLVLWLEDLQWSDYSTLDFLPYVAQRREAARLLVIGTYRPADVILSGHPLKGVKQELQAHQRCVELPLGFLSEAAVAQYLAGRFPGSELPGRLAQVIHQSTDGNPLFMVNVVDYLVGQGLLVEIGGKWELKVGVEEVEVGVPENLRQMIGRQIDRLRIEDQQVLEVASAVGMECAVAAVAAGLKAEVEEVEERCDGLARRGQFLQSVGMEQWPDGAVSGRYRFIHALYREVLYGRVAAAQRVRLHCRIGEREEAGYGERAGEIAGELAVHFEQGEDPRRAVQYLEYTAENALRRCANQEAIDHLTKGLKLLRTQPQTRERTQHEFRLEMLLRSPLIATKGYAAPEVEQLLTRVHELWQEGSQSPPKSSAEWVTTIERLVRRGSEAVKGVVRSGIHQGAGKPYGFSPP